MTAFKMRDLRGVRATSIALYSPGDLPPPYPSPTTSTRIFLRATATATDAPRLPGTRHLTALINNINYWLYGLDRAAGPNKPSRSARNNDSGDAP
jgi:hypothetical protein